MKLASKILPAERWAAVTAVDQVVLDCEERQRRRGVLIGNNGTRFLLDLPQPTMLRGGDGLLLDDGSIVAVAARPESLVEITAESATDLARLAWHLGNRHAAVQIVEKALRIRRDRVLEELLIRRGAKLTLIEAPFDPEGGAYNASHGHGD